MSAMRCMAPFPSKKEKKMPAPMYSGDVLIVVGDPNAPEETLTVSQNDLREQIEALVKAGAIPEDISVWKKSGLTVVSTAFDLEGSL